METAKQSPDIVFTPRESEILVLIAAGFGSKQIAGKLAISVNTVSNHRSNMLVKSGAKSSAELVSLNKKIIFK